MRSAHSGARADLRGRMSAGKEQFDGLSRRTESLVLPVATFTLDMILWIASSGRSGNTFFRVVLHHIYGIHTYAAFNASEVLLTAGAEELVGYLPPPEPLKSAIAKRDAREIRSALDELDARAELFVFKTHARAGNLFGTNFPAILLVRDGRDTMTSYANYLVDINFDSAALKSRVRKMMRSKTELLGRRSWVHLVKIFVMMILKGLGLRKWLVSRRIDQMLARDESGWVGTNRSWLERTPKPVIVRFDDLIRDPIGSATRAVDALGIGLVARAETAIPSFLELKERYPSFFRKGKSGDWRNHLSPGQERLFRMRSEEMMKTLHLPL